MENGQSVNVSLPTRARGTATAPLDDKQEKELVKWIRRMKELSAVPNITQITTSANQILNTSGSEASISKAWIDKFIKRHPKCARRLETTTAGVAPANIYNFDETTFAIGEGQKTVWMFSVGPPDPIDYNELPRRYCEWVTAVECVAADGWKTDPYLVIQGSHHLEEWFEQPGYSDQAVLNLIPTGRVTPNAALNWLQAFNEQTKDRVEEGQSRLLLFRGEPHFLTLKFIQFCDEHSIILFCFPSKMGHLMQPFDGKAFESYKD